MDALPSIERAEFHRTLDPQLLAALHAEPAVAARAALAIGRTRKLAGVPVLTAHLADAAPSVRAMSAYGLGLIANPAPLDALRLLVRRDPNSAVRYAALDAIGRIVALEPSLALPAVASDLEAELYADPDPDVRGHAAAQLETFGWAPSAVHVERALERAFGSERNSAVRWHVMWTIFRGFATRADPAVLDVAVRDPQELVRVEAVRAIARRPDADLALLRRLENDDPSWRVQFEARAALARARGRAPSIHLTAVPPGVRLPPLPPESVTRPLPAAVPEGSPRAPDPARVAEFPVTATSAAQLNGPQAGPHPRALIRTSKGDVIVRLYPEWAPATVANFFALARRGYFDGNRWFRIVPDFVVQTGDPHGNGDGDAGYTLPAEENPIEQRSFVISMGLEYKNGRALRDSAGTQFYITLSPQLHLDRAFTVFGEVERGSAVLAHLVESDRILAVRRIADD